MNFKTQLTISIFTGANHSMQMLPFDSIELMPQFAFFIKCTTIIDSSEKYNSRLSLELLALVVERADNVIQWINHYPVDKMHCKCYILCTG